MPRNVAKPLDRVDSIRQSRNLVALEGRNDSVTLFYTKRDGSFSQSTGTVEFFNGRVGYDTGSVTIATADKGNRTINLHNIITID